MPVPVSFGEPVFPLSLAPQAATLSTKIGNNQRMVGSLDQMDDTYDQCIIEAPSRNSNPVARRTVRSAKTHQTRDQQARFVEISSRAEFALGVTCPTAPAHDDSQAG
jgi:hypothetical protein